MKAAILRAGQMVVEELDDLSPGPGQVLVEPIACGICGSDLHTVDHAHDLVAAAVAAGVTSFTADFDPDQDLVMGHELSCCITGLGAGVSGISEGDEFAAMPYLETPDGRVVPGYSNRFPGGYSSQMLLSPEALLPIPNGLDPVLAALTEPMAVGLHAVNESSIAPDRIALVVGAGPVGLAIIAALAASGIEAIIAADFSPTRRRVAEHMGAHQVIDPATHSIVDAWRAGGDGTTPPVIYEAVGVPGMIDELMAQAPSRSEILVAGVCIPPDNFRPSIGIYKHLSLRFVLGWSPEEFRTSLHNLAEGRIDGSKLVTGHVGLDEVPQAFKDLADPEQHVKILVHPNGKL
ncbi:MAG: zinc-binding dehydrogenase [Acidimicrobiales bacterium]|nr:zinc-binding dehydrogenase [Acidimicrobiales bacterium]